MWGSLPSIFESRARPGSLWNGGHHAGLGGCGAGSGRDVHPGGPGLPGTVGAPGREDVCRKQIPERAFKRG